MREKGHPETLKPRLGLTNLACIPLQGSKRISAWSVLTYTHMAAHVVPCRPPVQRPGARVTGEGISLSKRLLYKVVQQRYQPRYLDASGAKRGFLILDYLEFFLLSGGGTLLYRISNIIIALEALSSCSTAILSVEIIIIQYALLHNCYSALLRRFCYCSCFTTTTSSPWSPRSSRPSTTSS